MEFLNLHSSALDSPEMAGADPAELGTWLMLARYCAGQENGGVIAGCREWRDRKWQTVARVAQAMVMGESELWEWRGDDLHVRHYPAEQEAVVKAKRERNRSAGLVKSEVKAEAARTNGLRGGRPRTRGVDENRTGEPTAVNGIRAEGNEREGNERKGEDKQEQEVLGLSEKGCGSGDSCSVGVDVNSREMEISRQAEMIVRSYPRQERFAEALVMVRRQLVAGESFPLMLAGTRAAAESLAKAPSGAANRYAPSALRFFEGKRWMDDPGTLVRPAVVPAGNGGGGKFDRGEMSAEEVAMQLGGRGKEW